MGTTSQVAEHVGGLLIVSAHDRAPFSVGSIVVRRDQSVDPISRSFSAEPARRLSHYAGESNGESR